MNGFDEFTQAIIKGMLDFHSRRPIENNKEETRAYSRYLMGIDGHPQPQRKPLTEDEKKLLRLWQGFSEIAKAQEVLHDIPFYLKRFPNSKTYKNQGITKSKYLHYHITHYLEESYVLKLRLFSFLKLIKKLFEKKRQAYTITKELKDFVKSCFYNSTTTRGAHVHQARFSPVDLDRLETLDFYGKYEQLNDSLVQYGNKYVYRQTRRRFVSNIKQSNEKIVEILDHYFEKLFAVIFDEQGQVTFE